MMGFYWFPAMRLMMLYWLVSIVFTVWALIRIAGSRKDAGYKIIWAAIVVFLGLLGVLLYYVLEMKER